MSHAFGFGCSQPVSAILIASIVLATLVAGGIAVYAAIRLGMKLAPPTVETVVDR